VRDAEVVTPTAPQGRQGPLITPAALAEHNAAMGQLYGRVAEAMDGVLDAAALWRRVRPKLDESGAARQARALRRDSLAREAALPPEGRAGG
jgi:hypothetical protein